MTPNGFAVMTQDGYFVGVWREREIAEKIINRSPGVKGERIVPVYFDPPDVPQPASFCLLSHLRRQREFSERTFGPGERTAGLVDHILKELHEVLDAPHDVSEWIDVVILALDGAWRVGFTPEQIIAALVAKQDKNERRAWPDWRTASPGRAIEHLKE